MGRKSDVVDWLLEEDQPSVRYYTLVDLLGQKENDPEVAEAYSKIKRKTVAGTASRVTKELLTAGKLSLRTLCYQRRKGPRASIALSSEESSFISKESFSMMEKKSTIPGSGSTTPFITTTTSLLVWILSRS